MPAPLSNDSGKASQWRFDAVDLRAGMAFASWRADIGEDPSPAETQLVYFSPPSFTPEPVANVALALGATRGTLRPGMLVGEREAAFRTLGEVGEFLRRAYVAGGGGDGADGGGEGGPSPPSPEPPDLPDLPMEEGDARQEFSGRRPGTERAAPLLLRLAVALKEGSPDVEAGTSRAVSWQELETADGFTAMHTGAIHVFRELLMRQPPAGNPGGHLRWLGEVGAWWRLLGSLRLHTIVLHAGSGPLLSLLVAWAKRHEPWLIEVTPGRFSSSLAMAVLVSGDERLRHLANMVPWSIDPEERWERWRYGGYPPYALPVLQAHAPESAASLPTTTLRALPLPKWAWPLVGSDLKGRASLYHLLCTLTAQPQLGTDPRHFELMLFASACVVGSRQPTLTSSPLWGLEEVFGPSEIEILAARQIAQEALLWLKEHLPRSTFSAGYEDEIKAVKDVRYRGGKVPPSASSSAP